MPAATVGDLSQKRCLPCEGKVSALSPGQVGELLGALPAWKLTADGYLNWANNNGRRIRREWRVKDFQTALDFFNRIGRLAEDEDHHPDLHLVGYRNVTIELWTHAVNGLTENDFILAAKIDKLPVELK